MKSDTYSITVPIPQGVTAVYANGSLVVKGPAGELIKKLKHPRITITTDNQKVTLSVTDRTQSDKMHIHTFRSHVRNLVHGAKEPYVYELKICSGHFPMTAKVTGDVFELKNFLGETAPRKVQLKKGSKVTVTGDIITVQSPDVELAGQVAADLEQLTRIVNRDRRVFQDGIYITKKAGESL